MESRTATQLAEKLRRYRGTLEFACADLFGGPQTVTLEYDDDGDDALSRSTPPLGTAPVRDTDVGAAPTEAAAPAGPPDCKTVRQQVEQAIGSIAEDFAGEFNAYLEKLAQEDSSTQQIAPRYVMGPQHIAELESAFAEPLVKLVDELEREDVAAARQAAVEAWPLLERRIREKWQAYFVMTFQDVSVERKAARDRRKLKPSVDPTAAELMANAEASRRSLPDLAAHSWDEPHTRVLTPWIAVAALLLLAATGGWLLMYLHAHRPPPAPATTTTTAPPPLPH